MSAGGPPVSPVSHPYLFSFRAMQHWPEQVSPLFSSSSIWCWFNSTLGCLKKQRRRRDPSQGFTVARCCLICSLELIINVQNIWTRALKGRRFYQRREHLYSKSASSIAYATRWCERYCNPPEIQMVGVTGPMLLWSNTHQPGVDSYSACKSPKSVALTKATEADQRGGEKNEIWMQI